MNLKTTIQKASRHTRYLRLETYRRIKKLPKDQKSIALMILILVCLISFPILMRCSLSLTAQKSSSISSPEDTGAFSKEEVHEDLGDAPVIREEHISLNELEKRVQMGELKTSIVHLDKGESLLTLLSHENVPTNDRVQVVDGLELLINLKTLKPGMQFMFFKDGPKVVGVSLLNNDGGTLAVLKEADGSWTPFSHTGRIETKTIRYTGEVDTTFARAAKNANIPDTLINQVINALDGELDFNSDIHSGTHFDLIAEYKETEGGLEVGGKQLLYIGIDTGNKQINRYAYTTKDGTATFYNARGKSASKQLMTRPLKARARLSSPYGRRMHPILGYEIFHKGVDLAAPKNTPVQAAADGVIQSIGRKGSYGKYMSVRHADGYVTAYAHLNGYRADLKVGSKVKRGEVIGYLGSTGRSTGPHLHFEVIKNKKIVPPFGKNVISARQLKDFDLEQFQSWAETVHPDFKQHLAGKTPPVPTQKPF